MAIHPMREMLEAVSQRISAHMPGHGGASPFPLPDLYRLDTTEISANWETIPKIYHAVIDRIRTEFRQADEADHQQ